MRAIVRGSLAAAAFAAVLCLAVPSASAVDANVYCSDSWQTDTMGNTIDTTSRFWDRSYHLGYDAWTGPIYRASMQITLPGGFDRWDSANGMYTRWDNVTKTWTGSAVARLQTNDYMDIGIDEATPLASGSPALAVTRGISNPVFSNPSNLETRTVTLSLVIAPNSLLGSNSLGVNLVNPDDMPAGLAIASVSGASIPSGFSSAGDPGRYYFDNGLAVPGLSGTYNFSAQVQFQRSGSRTQGAMGNLFFKPPAEVYYSNGAQIGPVTGTSVSTSFGSGVNATFSSSTTANYSGGRNSTEKNLRFDGIVAADNAAASVSSISMIREKRKSVTGQIIYKFEVGVEGSNYVQGNLTRPDCVTYPMMMDTDDGSMWFTLITTNESELSQFGTGTYTIGVKGSDNVTTNYAVPLSGTFPNEFPRYNQAMGFETQNRRPTVSWLAPTDCNINMCHISYIVGDNYDCETMITPATLSFTPPENVSLGGGRAEMAFARGAQGTANGVDWLSGFVTTSDLYFNVVPEPATMLLLGTGAMGLLGVIRRRRMR